MKKILGVFITAICLLSCSNDDNNNINDVDKIENQLEGIWRLKEITFNCDKVITTQNKEIVKVAIERYGFDLDHDVIFDTKLNTGTLLGGYKLKSKQSVEFNDQTRVLDTIFERDPDANTSNFKVEEDKSKLIFFNTLDSLKYDIVDFNRNKMIWSSPASEFSMNINLYSPVFKDLGLENIDFENFSIDINGSWRLVLER